MHIPKTAGTSIRSLLEEFYDEESRVYLYDEPPGISLPEFRELPERKKLRTRLVYGHFHFGVHQWLPQRSSYLTMLREPVERLVSLYHHYKHVDISRLHTLIVENNLSLEEFVFGGHTLQTDNEIVRQISGARGVHFGTCSDHLLESAWQNVEEHFAGMMFMDEMQQSMLNLRSMLGIPAKKLGRENVNRAQPPIASIDPALLQRIAEFTRFDCELYNRAKRKWGGDWSSSAERTYSIPRPMASRTPDSGERVKLAGLPGTPMTRHVTTSEDVIWAFRVLLGRAAPEIDLERNRIHFRTLRELTDWILGIPEFHSCAQRRREQAVGPQIAQWGARLLLHTELTRAEAFTWSLRWQNLDEFVVDLVGSDARKQRVADARPRQSLQPTIVLTKSMPRSGHHLLMNLLCEYYRHEIHYCEFYGGGEACCHQTPCTRPYHPLLDNKLFLQKSHDHELKDAADLPRPYLIQYRHPIPRLQSNYDHACRNSDRTRSHADFRSFAAHDTSYFIDFYNKWIHHPPARSFVLAYEDLLDDPRRSLGDLVNFLTPGVPPPEAKLRRALTLLRQPSASIPPGQDYKRRQVEAYEFFDASLYRDLEERIFAACPGLSSDRLF